MTSIRLASLFYLSMPGYTSPILIGIKESFSSGLRTSLPFCHMQVSNTTLLSLHIWIYDSKKLRAVFILTFYAAFARSQLSLPRASKCRIALIKLSRPE